MTNNDSSPQLLTARETAQQLRVNPETILRWVREDKLPAVKLPGGAIRIDPRQVEGLRPPVPVPYSFEDRLRKIENYIVDTLTPSIERLERRLDAIGR
jgi:excisionase family DNA binding protein